MTQDEIIEMAKQCGCWNGETCEMNDVGLEAFAKLVAAKEREACAKVCEEGIHNATEWDSSYWDQCCNNRAFAIRARGEA